MDSLENPLFSVNSTVAKKVKYGWWEGREAWWEELEERA